MVFLGYPLMQAADIVVITAQRIAGGEDPVSHLEITRRSPAALITFTVANRASKSSRKRRLKSRRQTGQTVMTR